MCSSILCSGLKTSHSFTASGPELFSSTYQSHRGEAALHCDSELRVQGVCEDWHLLERWHEPDSLWTRLGPGSSRTQAASCSSSQVSSAGCSRISEIPGDRTSSGKLLLRPELTILRAIPDAQRTPAHLLPAPVDLRLLPHMPQAT